MNKVKMELKIPKNKIIEYNGVEFEVIPFMGIAEQAVLIERYISDYFDASDTKTVEQSEHDYLKAEFNLVSRIISVHTNIDTSEVENDFYADSGLFEAIISAIPNYGYFRNRLNFVLADIKEQRALKSSIGEVLNGLISKGYALIDKLAEMNPAEIQKIQDESVKLLEKLEETSVLKPTPAPQKRRRTKKE